MIDRVFFGKESILAFTTSVAGIGRTAEQPWDQFLKRVISWEPKVPPQGHHPPKK